MLSEDGADRMPSLIVALHRDPAQWTALRCALNDLVEADAIVADSIGATLDVIDARTPDLILVDPFISPREADDLTGYLALLPEASHVQTITVPVVSPGFGSDGSLEVPNRLGWLKRRLLPNRDSRSASTVAAWRPEVFAAEVATYLSLSQARRADKEQLGGGHEFLRAVERRGASRRSAERARLVLPVFVTTDRADLVNISSTGLLVRTDTRPSPRLPGLQENYSRNQLPLTLSSASGEAIHWKGTPVRCRSKSLGDGRFLYEVAFRFDEPLDFGGDSATHFCL